VGLKLKKVLFKNGIKFIYKFKGGDISSFCAGFEAGALNEEKFKMGTAHAVEHMISKGTHTKSEADINCGLSEIFGFENAMTNYPYTVYYGTCLSESFRQAIEFYSDILINPSFPERGFKEEIDIICQELKEWKDDSEASCEAQLFENCFSSSRIGELIIGNEESVRSITPSDVKSFYNQYYFPQNLVISVVTSLSFEETLDIFECYFGGWNRKSSVFNTPGVRMKRVNTPGVFIARQNIQSAKIEYCFNCDMLKPRELYALKLFSLEFGEGSNSMLFKVLRTENGICYDVSSSIEMGAGIKLFIIKLGTSHENTKNAMRLIEDLIADVKADQYNITQNKINKLVKRYKLLKALKYEKSIQMAFKMTTHELMLHEWPDNLITEDISETDISLIINKVLVNPSVQILTNSDKSYNLS
jgi:predicted Zn-dependent peptidase